MATVAEMLKEKFAEARSAKLTTAKTYPVRSAMAEMDTATKAVLPRIHTELASATEYLKEIRGPIRERTEALRGLEGFGGDINRHLVYHMIDKHRRDTSFTPLVQRFLKDYKKAHELDHTLTREQFISTYSDQIMEFLAHYSLSAQTLNASRIEYLSLRVLIAIVEPSKAKYGAQFEAARELALRGQKRFYAWQDKIAKMALRQGGF